jgi:hypothetical protein
MLRRMALADQWEGIRARLPEEWGSAGLRLDVRSAAQRPRAAALLGPLTPGVQGPRALVLTVARDGSASAPDRLLRALRQLDAEHIAGMLRLVSLRETDAPVAREHRPLAASWAEQLAELPADWSDLLAEIELLSTDHLDRAALLAAPVNPSRQRGAAPAFRFRCARRFGYGVSPQMAARCLERLDEDEIRGDVRILRVLADTKPVATQGPVWYLGERAV